MPDYAYAGVTVGLKRGAKSVRLESTDDSTVRQMAQVVREWRTESPMGQIPQGATRRSSSDGMEQHLHQSLG